MTGIPFKYNGRNRDGVDCLGLVYLYLKENNLEIPDTDGREITADWYNQDEQRLLKGLQKYMVEVDKPQKFDVLLFKMEGKLKHIGVMIDHHRFLHIRQNRKSTITKLRGYKRYLAKVFRHKELI
jgi:cell wall-associated NlpC family hydrolase